MTENDISILGVKRGGGGGGGWEGVKRRTYKLKHYLAIPLGYTTQYKNILHVITILLLIRPLKS